MLRAVAILALVVTTTSKPPIPTPAKVAQAKQEQARAAQGQTTTDNQQAKNPPPAVHQTNPEITVRYEQHFSDQDKKAATRIDWPSRVVAACTVGLLILAFFQWLAMHGQRKLMHTQARLMIRQLGEMKASREHAYALARARIVIDSIETTSWYENHVPNDITVTFRNTGQTPAINVTLSGDRFVRQGRIMPGKPGAEDPRNLLESNVTIGANDTM